VRETGIHALPFLILRAGSAALDEETFKRILAERIVERVHEEMVANRARGRR